MYRPRTLRKSRDAGRMSVPNVPLVVFDLGAIEEQSGFFLECSPAVVLILVGDVNLDLVCRGVAHREIAITRLPVKVGQPGRFSFDPRNEFGK